MSAGDVPIEVILSRWSSGMQWISIVMIALFFGVLSRRVPMPELRLWYMGWLANVVSLGVAFVYWYYSPSWGGFLTGWLHSAAKITFVALLAAGARSLKRTDTVVVDRRLFFGIAVVATLAASFVGELAHFAVAQSTVIGVLWLIAFRVVGRLPRMPGESWLAGAFLLRAALSLVEAVNAGLIAFSGQWIPRWVAERAVAFASVSAFLDLGAEWLVALASVLAISEWTQHRLRQSNEDLLKVQQDLRRLADRDPLTALHNRRALPELLRAVQPKGARLLFFDLDGFKQINDRFGHRAGDDCLRHFAEALGKSFRPSDALVRYGGDEFLVVAQGLDEAHAEERIESLRAQFAARRPPIGFSVGAAQLEPGGIPEAVLEQADRAMYARKKARPQSTG